MSDKQLIDELAILHNCIYSNGKPNRTQLAKIIQVEYPTLASWYQNNQIPQCFSFETFYIIHEKTKKFNIEDY